MWNVIVNDTNILVFIIIIIIDACRIHVNALINDLSQIQPLKNMSALQSGLVALAKRRL